ncbi:MAG TPA: peroxiredoxin [Balneolales bacterium]|nr:peroxiredoxin [Balneolales bacterium]
MNFFPKYYKPVMFKKYRYSPVLVFVFCLFITLPGFAQSMKSKGAAAPMFTAKASQAGSEFEFSLKKALAKGPVVLYFYPAAYTGGCDLEAHTFAELKDKFTAAGATIIGVSADDIQRLNSFSSDPNYCAGKFPVASDPNGKIAATYGLTLVPPQPGVKDVRGKQVTHGFIPRTTFVINKKGIIVATFSSKKDHITPDEHVKKALAIVKGL